MNCYQKINASITLLAAGLTATAAFICFMPPYSPNFLLETAALIVSELVLGGSTVLLAVKSDKMMFHSSGYTICCGIYFFCMLLMIPVACSSIAFRYFLAIHLVLLVFWVILLLCFRLAELHIMQQEKISYEEMEYSKAEHSSTPKKG